MKALATVKSSLLKNRTKAVLVSQREAVLLHLNSVLPRECKAYSAKLQNHDCKALAASELLKKISWVKFSRVIRNTILSLDTLNESTEQRDTHH